jgi:hypothetical protein
MVCLLPTRTLYEGPHLVTKDSKLETGQESVRVALSMVMMVTFLMMTFYYENDHHQEDLNISHTLHSVQ